LAAHVDSLAMAALLSGCGWPWLIRSQCIMVPIQLSPLPWIWDTHSAAMGEAN
jgi:hypothetical protein